MTAPGKDETKKTSTSENVAAEKPAAEPESRFSKHDLIPIPLLVGIFAVIMMVTWFLLAENWVTEMTRYRSLRALNNGDYPTAIKHLKKLVAAGAEANDKMTSNSPTYLSEIGLSYMRQEKYDEALQWYRLAQANWTNIPPDEQGNPRTPVDFHNQIGYIQFQMGNYDEAEKSLRAALAFNVLDPIANFMMGKLAMHRENYVKAADYFKVVATRPEYKERVQKYYEEIEEKLFADIK